MLVIMKIQYRCLSCGFQWARTTRKGNLPLGHVDATVCPQCNHNHIQWFPKAVIKRKTLTTTDKADPKL